jgi:hypothetical protein
MADYNPSRRHGLQNYLSENAGRDAYGHPIRTSAEQESLPRNPTQFEEDVRIIYDELMSVLLAKHRDYGPRNIADAPGGALNGLRVRIHDKVARINNLIDNSRKPQYESLEDSFKDLANYAIIALLVLRDKWDK